MASSEQVAPISEPRAHAIFALHYKWPLPLVLSCALVTIAIFWRTAISIPEIWATDRTFAHGFLIIPLVFYLLWTRRGRIVPTEIRPCLGALPVIALLGIVWFLGLAGQVQVVQQFALVGMLVAFIWASLGTDVVRRLRFPLAFLFFAVPCGDNLVGALQDFTAHFSVLCLKLTGIPVILESRTLILPSGIWVVAEACSGIRYLTSCVVLGLVYSSIVYRTWWRRLAFMLASVLLPILANGLRAYGIILLGYLSNNRLAAGVDHIIYGWLFFTLLQFLLFSVGLRWRESASNIAPTNMNKEQSQVSADKGRSKLVPACLTVVCGLILLVPPRLGAEYLARNADKDRLRPPTPVVVAPWTRAVADHQTWAPALHSTVQLTCAYVSADKRVDVHLASYSGADRVEFLDDYNRVSDPAVWRVIAMGTDKIVVNGRALSVPYDVVESHSQSRIVWTWYWNNGEVTGSPTMVKLLQAKARLMWRPGTTALIALSAPYRFSPSEAESVAQEFLHHFSIVPDRSAAK